MHSSVTKICQKFFENTDKIISELDAWHFCDNERDADECAALVVSGVKKATSPSLWWHEFHNEPLPKVGDLNIVTNWSGEALCIIETTAVEIQPFNRITKKYAELEGEGDKSLSYWRRVHWEYYHRELKNTSFTPIENMPIVCEQFKVVFQIGHNCE